MAACFGKPDEFLQPGGAGCFQVKPRAETADGPADWGVNGKLVAAGMHREFQIGRQAELLDGKGDYRQIFIKFLLKLLQISDVIYPFVESAGKFGGDGLRGDALAGDGRQNQQQFYRRLRLVGFIHRHLGDKLSFAFSGNQIAVYLACLLHGQEVFGGGGLKGFFTDDDGPFDAGNLQRAEKIAAGADKGLGGVRGCRAADFFGNIQREKIAARDKGFDIFEIDMVGIHIITGGPAQSRSGLVRLGADVRRFGADDGMLAK